MGIFLLNSSKRLVMLRRNRCSLLWNSKHPHHSENLGTCPFHPMFILSSAAFRQLIWWQPPLLFFSSWLKTGSRGDKKKKRSGKEKLLPKISTHCWTAVTMGDSKEEREKHLCSLGEADLGLRAQGTVERGSSGLSLPRLWQLISSFSDGAWAQAISKKLWTIVYSWLQELLK